MKKLLTGNEAVARGAYECGVTFASGYPGTPSTEILEALTGYPGVDARWAPNEKVAYESGVGASLGGARVLVTMKHVGVNVAADPLFSHSYMGVNGGLVVVSADDPGMHSSQNEQDNRWLARAAKIPMIEPSTSEEAKEFTRLAFELSEAYDTPVMLRLTTRICHAEGEVDLGEPKTPERKPFRKDPSKYVLLPANARRRHVLVEERMQRLKVDASSMRRLNVIRRRGADLGVISSGAAWLYAMESFPEASHLKIGLTNPLPETLIRDFAASVRKVIVVEELDPYLEEQIRSLGIDVQGRDLRPETGELDPDLVAAMADFKGRSEVPPPVVDASLPARPPVLCPGCGHRGVFTVLQRLNLIVTGDIGCYTLGALKPLNAMDTCLCMGASVGMSTGLSRALPPEDRRRVVGVIGDSTFVHSGITGLVDAVYNGGTGTILVLDNRTTAMTGHQPHPATGKRLNGEDAPRLDIPALARAVGIRRVRTADAYRLLDLEKAVREEVEADEPSVIVVQNGCVLNEKLIFAPPVQVRADQCTHCESCLSIGCPAIGFVSDSPTVNQELCNGCSMCQQVCYDCPAGNDVAGFLELTVQKRYAEAYDLLTQTNPFPSITGRVCPHPCETDINTLGLDLHGVYDQRFAELTREFGTGDGARFSIRAVEKFIGDWGLEHGRRNGNGQAPDPRTEKVAVVGSGPAGLAGAWYLAGMGYAVTVLEQLPEIGGMLRAGIPDFRLPRETLDRFLVRLGEKGVTFRTDIAVGRELAFGLIDRDFDAVVLATGFSETAPMGVPGEDLAGVVHGVELLRDLNLGRKVEVGKHVLVVGGGNTAMDVARSVKRRGATPVVVYRRGVEDMPAIPEEVEDLQKEGIPVVTYAAPIRIGMQGGRLSVTFTRMRPGEPDASGRRRPVPVEGSEYTEEYDQVVTAVGERAGFSDLPPELLHDRKIVTTDFSTATNLPGVFAAGDLSTGFGTVSHAVRSGKKAAEAVHAYLTGAGR